MLALTVLLVYLELPLRAGPFRAPLVYGTPDTWEGFKYIVLAEQFRDSVIDPFGDLPRKFGDLVTRTSTQFGILAPLIPIAFIATALRRPRYALLTGTAVAITCFFAASYVNADISRYYLGPAADGLDVAGDPGGGRRRPPGGTGRRGDRRAPPPTTTDAPFAWTPAVMIAAVLAVALVVPTLLDVPTRYRAVDANRQLEAATWTDHALEAMEPNAAIVSWWSFSTPLWYAQKVQGRRPDIEIIDDRTRLDENLGQPDRRHRRQPREAPGLRHPGRPERGPDAGRPLRPRLHRWWRRAVADTGDRAQGRVGPGG